MECNKDEAVRAREIAEKKMQSGDFVGAQKIGLKAQKLFQDLENLPQLLTVCAVHCSAQNKVSGSDLDWYGILQVEQQADEMTIKKQYRKLALSLHPDKNKFAGAEAAFKLIGEANRVLMDRQKRYAFDIKYNMWSKRTKQSYLPTGYFSTVNPPKAATKFQNESTSQANGPTSHQQTQPCMFWTGCLSCGTRFKYSRMFMNKSLLCASCGRNFIAYDLGTQTVRPGSSFPNQKENPKEATAKTSRQSRGGNFSKASVQNNNSGLDPGLRARGMAGVGKAAEDKVKGVRESKEMPEPRPAVAKGPIMSQKRGRKQMCEDGWDAENNNSSNKANDFGQDIPGQRNEYSRTSLRKRQRVSYKEELDENNDNFFSGVNRPKGSSFSSATEDMDKGAHMDSSAGATNASAGVADLEHQDEKPEVSNNSDSESEAEEVAEIMTCPDPEFSDFDKGKGESCFSVGQFWALYEPGDGMPRFYARVSKVLSPSFKLRITWLEANPDSKHEIHWLNQNLPIACGKYKLGKSQEITDLFMFSHQIDCRKGTGRGPFFIYPKKGETWAIFRDWDTNWSSDPENRVTFKYEYVEVLSDFVETTGLTVAYLGKIEGFVSLFKPIEQDGVSSFQIPSNDLYRFSHQIPSFRMTGREGDGVPKGSYEFDPASLPPDFHQGGNAEGTESIGTQAPGSCFASLNTTKPSTHLKENGTPKHSKTNNTESETLNPRRSPRISNGIAK